jgi:hypothetical protein
MIAWQAMVAWRVIETIARHMARVRRAIIACHATIACNLRTCQLPATQQLPAIFTQDNIYLNNILDTFTNRIDIFINGTYIHTYIYICIYIY